MEYVQFEAFMRQSYQDNGLKTYETKENIEAFYVLTNIMLEKNGVMNLTAIRDIEKIIPLHYMDCLKIAHLIPKQAKVIDIGCGGGFPTLPLAIVRRDITILGVDSTEKKVKYVAEAANALSLNNVSTISARAEELARLPQMRENFDIAVSRAVARLNILDELCLPFIKVGGEFIVMKGSAGEEEYKEAINGINKLGGKLKKLERDILVVSKELEEDRTIIDIQKINQTPTQYPRMFSQIKRKPL